MTLDQLMTLRRMACIPSSGKYPADAEDEDSEFQAIRKGFRAVDAFVGDLLDKNDQWRTNAATDQPCLDRDVQRVLWIPDLHGDIAAFLKSLALLKPPLRRTLVGEENYPPDRFVQAGDLLDRGIHSIACLYLLHLLSLLGFHVTRLLGNHEECPLRGLRGGQALGMQYGNDKLQNRIGFSYQNFLEDELVRAAMGAGYEVLHKVMHLHRRSPKSPDASSGYVWEEIPDSGTLFAHAFVDEMLSFSDAEPTHYISIEDTLNMLDPSMNTNPEDYAKAQVLLGITIDTPEHGMKSESGAALALSRREVETWMRPIQCRRVLQKRFGPKAGEEYFEQRLRYTLQTHRATQMVVGHSPQKSAQPFVLKHNLLVISDVKLSYGMSPSSDGGSLAGDRGFVYVTGLLFK